MGVRIEQSQDWMEMARAEAIVPEFTRAHSASDFEAKLSGRVYLALLAWDGDRIVGSKIGYALEPTVFYSWIGGVNPDYRAQGLAAELLHRQEAWCSERGFQRVRVKSENRFRGMLIFLLKNGYEIRAVNGRGQIEFEKTLLGQIT